MSFADSKVYVQCAAMSHPSELVLIEEIALGVFLERDGGKAGRKPAIVVLSYVRNNGDSGGHLVDVIVKERDEHGTGTNVAGRTARWRACWKCTWRISRQLIELACAQRDRVSKTSVDLLFAILYVVRY